MVEDDHCPLLGRQPPEPTVQLVTNRDRALRISAGRSNRAIDVEFHGRMASVTFGGSIASTDEDAMEPRIEAIGITQPSQVLPSSDQGILDGVLRHLVVAQDQAGDAKQATRTPRRQRRERIQVTSPGTNYEVALDRTPSGSGGESQPSEQSGPSNHESVPFR